MAPSSGSSLARRERAALCDLAVRVGPEAPTLCTGWSVRDLVVHLLIRERKPWAAGGIVLPALARMTDGAAADLARRPLPELVDRLRTPPLPLRLGAVDALANTIEFFVHHEDIRRAQPSWESRPLSSSDQAALWRSLSLVGRGLVRSAGVPVIISAGSRRAVLRAGDEPVVVSGPVGELALFLFGRAQVTGLTFDGPAAKVSALQAANLGF